MNPRFDPNTETGNNYKRRNIYDDIESKNMEDDIAREAKVPAPIFDDPWFKGLSQLVGKMDQFFDLYDMFTHGIRFARMKL